MTKAVFDKIIDKANHNPVILYGDNMLLFAVNFEGSYILQDDECVYCFRINKTAGGNAGISQQQSPYEVVVFDYDQIQYAKVFPDTKTLIKLFDGLTPAINSENIEDIKKAIISDPVMNAHSPRGVTGSEVTITAYGDVPGATMVMGKDLDNFTKNAQDYHNGQLSNQSKI